MSTQSSPAAASLSLSPFLPRSRLSRLSRLTSRDGTGEGEHARAAPDETSGARYVVAASAAACIIISPLPFTVSFNP